MARESELPMDSDPIDLNSFTEDINNPMLTHNPNQNNVVATPSTFPFQLVNLNLSNRNQTSHETLKEIDFFKVNNIDHNKGKKIALSLDNDHIDTNLLKFKLNVSDSYFNSSLFYFIFIYYIIMFINFKLLDLQVQSIFFF
jgi:hypothetical protein